MSLHILRPPTAACPGDGSEGRGTPKSAGPSEHVCTATSRSQKGPQSQVIRRYTRSPTLGSPERAETPRETASALPPAPCTSPVARFSRLLLSRFCARCKKPHVTSLLSSNFESLEQASSPVGFLVSEIVREELLQKQGLPSCTVTYAAGISARMLTLCFNPAFHLALFLLPLLSSEAFSLCVCVLYNFWHLPSRFEAFESLLPCPDHIDCSWPLRTVANVRSTRFYSPLNSFSSGSIFVSPGVSMFSNPVGNTVEHSIFSLLNY